MPKRVVDGTYFFFYTLYCVFFKNSDSNSGLLDASKNGRNNCFLKSSFCFRKESSKDEFWTVIRKNMKKNNHAFTYISVTGQCCWKTCDRFGTCDEFGPGDEKSPRGQFIKSIRGSEC